MLNLEDDLLEGKDYFITVPYHEYKHFRRNSFLMGMVTGASVMFAVLWVLGAYYVGY